MSLKVKVKATTNDSITVLLLSRITAVFLGYSFLTFCDVN